MMKWTKRWSLLLVTMATVILVASLAIWIHPYFWLALIPALFLRSLLRELGCLHDLDERELLMNYRASHITLILTLILATFFILLSPQINADRTNQEVTILLVIPLIIRLASLYAFTHSTQRAGIIIGLIFGGFWTLFTLISHGISIGTLVEGSIGISILATALLGMKKPKLSGSLFLLEGVLAFVFILHAHYEPSVRFIMALTLPSPLLISGLFLISTKIEELVADETLKSS